MTIKCKRMSEVIEEERKELKTYMEEMKKEKELRSKIEKEVREEVTIKFKRMSEVIEEERKEMKTYMEELREIKELVKNEIESIIQLQREKNDIESTREEEEEEELITNKSEHKLGARTLGARSRGSKNVTYIQQTTDKKVNTEPL